MRVQQFVMAYKIEQDRVRAMLPDGYESLRPVLRINAEIRENNGQETVYIEFNTPVAADGKRGWLNIENWETPATAITYSRSGSSTTFESDFLTITYMGVGIEGGCPAEKDNDGCFFIGERIEFRPKELIGSNREYCDCSFQWKFTGSDAGGKSEGGKSVPAFMTEQVQVYEKQELTAGNAACIKCEQVLGSYKVEFERFG